MNADRLSPRQAAVIKLFAEGYTATEVGRRLGIGRETVRHHLYHIKESLGANNAVHALFIAQREGLIDDDPEVTA